MHIDHRLAPVQFVEHRPVARIAQPAVAVVGLQADAVGLERVEDILDFALRAIGVEHRQGRNQAEPAGIEK